MTDQRRSTNAAAEFRERFSLTPAECGRLAEDFVFGTNQGAWFEQWVAGSKAAEAIKSPPWLSADRSSNAVAREFGDRYGWTEPEVAYLALAYVEHNGDTTQAFAEWVELQDIDEVAMHRARAQRRIDPDVAAAAREALARSRDAAGQTTPSTELSQADRVGPLSVDLGTPLAGQIAEQWTDTQERRKRAAAGLARFERLLQHRQVPEGYELAIGDLDLWWPGKNPTYIRRGRKTYDGLGGTKLHVSTLELQWVIPGVYNPEPYWFSWDAEMVKTTSPEDLDRVEKLLLHLLGELR